MNNETNWTENVIVADADHIDRVAFDLTVNFERMLGRRIPQADMARWIDCVALDGGMRKGNNETLVVLIHDKQRQRLENFAPGNYQEELNGKAFRDHLGEFVVSALPVEELTRKEDFFCETVELLCRQAAVRRIMIVPGDDIYKKVRETLRRMGSDLTSHKDITLFSMSPGTGGDVRHEILGFSLMSALGIRGDELKFEQEM
jgi:hypothetical protein